MNRRPACLCGALSGAIADGFTTASNDRSSRARIQSAKVIINRLQAHSWSQKQAPDMPPARHARHARITAGGGMGLCCTCDTVHPSNSADEPRRAIASAPVICTPTMDHE
jgi:hypothetical protein